MARKPGEFGILGLTEQNKQAAEFVGIKNTKENWEAKDSKPWKERFKEGVTYAKDKISGLGGHIKGKIRDFKQRNELISLNISGGPEDNSKNNFTEADRQELHGNLEKLVKQPQSGTEKVGKVIEGEAIKIGKQEAPTFDPQAKYNEKFGIKNRQDSEAITKELPKIEEVNKELADKSGEEIAGEVQKDVEVLENISGEARSSAERRPDGELITNLEQVGEKASLKLEALKSQLEQTDSSSEDLQKQFGELKAKMDQIHQMLVEQGVLAGSEEKQDNVVDMADWKAARGKESKGEQSSEIDIETAELSGDQAVEKALERYGFMFLEKEDGAQWLASKFEDGAKNNADMTIALGVLRQYKDDRENGQISGLGAIDENHVVSKAIDHLEGEYDYTGYYSKPEKTIANWLEAEANLTTDPEKQQQAEKRLELINPDQLLNRNTMLEAQHALEGLRKDKDFWGQFDLDTIDMMQQQLKTAQERLDQSSKFIKEDVNEQAA